MQCSRHPYQVLLSRITDNMFLCLHPMACEFAETDATGRSVSTSGQPPVPPPPHIGAQYTSPSPASVPLGQASSPYMRATPPQGPPRCTAPPPGLYARTPLPPSYAPPPRVSQGFYASPPSKTQGHRPRRLLRARLP
ncbi:hypothetical protein JVT61DRAFT_10105 [Boletus reticuloceps]|uniref:Uncharacterized protein n=1 Tax=Boletus reticuloceps TaxID=495285 RepID=A0A8I3ABU4_9AGAM|nr:hypothetical protein JVT61DRAFT_10105 [Boletus reticuloceps]